MPYKDNDIINYIIENEPSSFEERLFFYLKHWNKLSFDTDRNKWERWFVKLVLQVLEDNGKLKYLHKNHKSDIESHLRKSYRYVKRHYDKRERESGGYYIDHLIRVAFITLFELPNPNIKKIFISLFHDIVEDIHIDLSEIISRSWRLWVDVANSVKLLTKNDLRIYLTKQEEKKLGIDIWKFESSKDFRAYLISLDKFEIYEIARERRNEEYFGSLKDLDDDSLDVKFADRIHNLRTLEWISPNKVVRKFMETIKYFVPLSKQRNKTAYILIMVELVKISKMIKSDKNMRKLCKKYKNINIPSESILV